MTETKKTISVYIETEIQEKIQTRAKEENRTFSNMLNIILRKALFSGKKEK
ncbi:MAG: hypothetical protein KBF93_15285 [Leptospiraceae bacterium]|mgnify:FL=1|nr:hypothetical protein [Leptospiraceae bacterium]